MLSEGNGMKWVLFGSHIFTPIVFNGWVAWLTATFAAGEKSIVDKYIFVNTYILLQVYYYNRLL